ncbi:MAG: hypothetical protein JNL58_32775 [Planctomyces sp.]|nr:hypothetical protein [Planctomyces sp.]
MALSFRPVISNSSFVWSVTIEEPRKRVANNVDHYNTVRQSLDHNELDPDGG